MHRIGSNRLVRRILARSSRQLPLFPHLPAGLSQEAQRWAAALLADAKLLATAPALADPQALLASATRLDSSFICMPQQRNMYGRVFGGFLMRCAGWGEGRRGRGVYSIHELGEG